MGFGSLDERIIIQTVTETVSGNGERTEAWSTYLTCWAGVDYSSGGESYEGGQVTASNTVVFMIRYYAGITEKMRVSYQSAYWDIEKIVEQGRERYLLLTAKKRD